MKASENLLHASLCKEPNRESHSKPVYSVRRAQNWDELMVLFDWFAEPDKQWVYRGQACVEWGLETTFERAVRRFNLEGRSRSTIEDGLLRQFKRRAHHYLRHTPEKEDWVEWLALMQHHGAPTRLLDWTYSLNVALYFAMEYAKTSCAIWALDSDWVADRVKHLQPEAWKLIGETDRNLEQPGAFKAVFASGKRFVCAVNPYRLNERLAVQQGVFVCPGNISESFEVNLAALFPGGQPNDKFVKCIIEFDRPMGQEIIRWLNRMNMTSRSLFPGLDGFARSLALALASPKFLVPDGSFPDQ